MAEGTRRQRGLTLIEMTLVVATIALLAGFALPAVRALVGSFHSEGGAKSMIQAALSSARAMATSRQEYVGIRFQTAYGRNVANPDDPLATAQYMVFIIHDPTPEPNGTGFSIGFRVIEGLKPIKLPEGFYAVDPTIVTRTRDSQNRIRIDEQLSIDSDDDLDTLPELRDVTAFSLVFSPAGRLIVHDVRVWNRQGRTASSSTASTDRIFNSMTEVVEGDTKAMFYQDDYPELGLGPEPSRMSFIVCEKDSLLDGYTRKQSWTDYLQYRVAERVYVSPYTGNLISSE